MATKACKRLLKCFCGCTDLTEEDVQRIYQFSVQATLIDRQAVDLLRSFLKVQRSGDKSEAEQFLDVYNLCGTFLSQSDRILTLDELDELCELGMPYHMEKDLKTQIQTGDRNNMERCLFRLQGECRNEIEASTQYKNFKQAILDKLKYRV